MDSQAESAIAAGPGLGAILALLIVIAISVWLGTLAQRAIKQGSFLKGYFLGNRGLGAAWAQAGVTATVQSGGTFMGYPSLVYSHGWIVALWIGSYMVVPITGFGVLGKRFAQLSRRTGAITVPDLLRIRFGSPAVGLISSLFIILFMSSMMVAQFKAGAIVMKLTLPGTTSLALSEDRLRRRRPTPTTAGRVKPAASQALDRPGLLAVGLEVAVFFVDCRRLHADWRVPRLGLDRSVSERAHADWRHDLVLSSRAAGRGRTDARRHARGYRTHGARVCPGARLFSGGPAVFAGQSGVFVLCGVDLRRSRVAGRSGASDGVARYADHSSFDRAVELLQHAELPAADGDLRNHVAIDISKPLDGPDEVIPRLAIWSTTGHMSGAARSLAV